MRDRLEKTLRRRLAANIRRLRLAASLSQETLAANANIHRTYLSSVERGERNIGIDNIESLANALRVDAAALLATEQLETFRVGQTPGVNLKRVNKE